MTNEKTTTIPTEDQQQAQELFKNAINEKNVVFLVVLGEDEVAQGVKEIGSRLTDTASAGFGRRVIWIKDKAILEAEIKALKAGAVDISNQDLSGIVAFSVSLDQTVMDIIKTTETIDELRVDEAFLAAGEA